MARVDFLKAEHDCNISPSGIRKALVSPISVAALSLAAIIKVAVLFSILPHRFKDWDFDVYYASSFALRRHLDPYTTNFSSIATQLGISLSPKYKTDFTPTFLLLFEPLCNLSMQTAYWIWIALSVVSLVAVLYMLLKPSISNLTGGSILIFVGLTLLYQPVAIHFIYAQSQLFILLLLTIAIQAMRKQADRLAGAVVALAGLLRAFPLLIIGYFLIRRRWQSLFWAAAVLAAGIAITIAFIGPFSLHFAKSIGWATHEYMENPKNLALSATVSRIYWWTAPQTDSRNVELFRKVLVAIAELSIFILTIRASVLSRNEEKTWGAFSLWIILAIIISPIAWSHYLVLLIIPYIQIGIAAEAGKASRRVLCLTLVSYGLIGFSGKVGGCFAIFQKYPEMMDEAGFVSLIAAYFANYYFICDYPGNVASSEIDDCRTGNVVRSARRPHS